MVGAGEVDLAGGKANNPGFLVEVLRDIRRFRGVDRVLLEISYNVDVDLHHEDEDSAVEGKGLYNQIYSRK